MTALNKALAGLGCLIAALAFANLANAASLAEPTISQMNYCALYGKTEKLGKTHIKCCTKKYCITCNIEINECWIKRNKHNSGAVLEMTPAPNTTFTVTPESAPQFAR